MGPTALGSGAPWAHPEPMADETKRSMEELSVAECLELLGGASVGRIAVAGPDGPPLVIPVNFVMDGDVIVFRTGVGAKLDGLRRHPASFQIDWVDPFHRTGWSVLVQGFAYEGSPPNVDLDPWDDGPKIHWVRLLPATITGRRLRLESIELDQRGYR